MKLLLLIAYLLVLLFNHQETNFEFPGEFLYFKELPSGDKQVIYRDSHNVHAFTYSQDECYSLSGGEYWEGSRDFIVISRREKPTSIEIYGFKTGQKIPTISWQEQWRPCWFAWLGTDKLILLSEEGEMIFSLSLSTGAIEEDSAAEIFLSPIPPHCVVYSDIHGNHFTYNGSCEKFTQQLPDFNPDSIYALYVGSPNPDLVIYPRCIHFNDKNRCKLWLPVLYNIAEKRNLKIFDDFIVGLVLHYTGREVGTDLVEFSPSGRYIFYFDSFSSLKVFDVETGKIAHHLQFPEHYQIAFNVHITWSSDDSQVAFMIDDERLTDQNERHLAVFNNLTGELVFTENPVSLATGWVLWSPDDRIIAFRNLRGELVIYTTPSMEEHLIDTNIIEVRYWSDLT